MTIMGVYNKIIIYYSYNGIPCLYSYPKQYSSTLCIWGHTYSRCANVHGNLIFLTPRYKYLYVHIGVGEGVGVKKCCFSGNFVYILQNSPVVKIIFT